MLSSLVRRFVPDVLRLCLTSVESRRPDPRPGQPGPTSCVPEFLALQQAKQRKA